MSAETSSLSGRFAPQAQPAGSAITRNAAPSGDYIIKLAEAQAVLAQAAAQFAGDDGAPSKVTQASSLGAEDVVISHLINSLKLDMDTTCVGSGKERASDTRAAQRVARAATRSRSAVAPTHVSRAGAAAGTARGSRAPCYAADRLA